MIKRYTVKKNVLLKRRKYAFKPYWKDSKSWICPKHLPSVSIPAHIDKCWYAGCTSQRPERKLILLPVSIFLSFKILQKQKTSRQRHPKQRKIPNKPKHNVQHRRRRAIKSDNSSKCHEKYRYCSL